MHQDKHSLQLNEIREASDPMLNVLARYISAGWPDEKRKLPQELHPFWDYRDTIYIKSGLITKGNRIIVPSEMR